MLTPESETRRTRMGATRKRWFALGLVVLLVAAAIAATRVAGASGLLALFVLVVAGVLLAGARASAVLRRRYSPLGRFIDLGGYRLHLIEQGRGGPTVVVEAGQGDFSLSWLPLQTALAAMSRVALYDRAGLGWSDPSPAPRTAEVMVDELHELLQRAGLPAPYVLVGHSIGGLVVRLYAHQYPQEVAGLVLVDSSHEEQFAAEPVQQALRQMSRLMPVLYGALGALVRSGLAALNPALLPDAEGIRSKLPPEIGAQYGAVLATHPQHIATAAAELRDLAESHRQLRAAQITSLGDLPLIVLRHGREQPMMGDPGMARLLEETFARLQGEMATLSTRGRLIVAEGSGHAIHLDEPELVAWAIREVIALARRKPDKSLDRGSLEIGGTR